MKRIGGVILVVLGLALASDVWHLAVSNPDPSVQGPVKVVGLGLAALILAVYSWRVARSSSSAAQAIAWPVAAGAAAGLVIAYFAGTRVQWGVACNQCRPLFFLVISPLVLGGGGLLCALPFAWYYHRRSRRPAA